MKNKKILGALAALCMGIILCVSSVFAINYWYTINNGGAQDNAVSTGKSLKLALTDTSAAEYGLYPGGIVDFGAVKVTGANDWTAASSEVTNTELPKFALIVDEIDIKVIQDATVAGTAVDENPETAVALQNDFNSQFTVWQDEANAGTFVQVGNITLTDNMVIFGDLQALDADNDGNITFNLRLAFNADADVKYEQHTLTITLKVVAYLGTAKNAGEILADDAVLSTKDDVQADNDNDTTPNQNAGTPINPATQA
jgi:hypothetical protein